jgi:uncharacterized membrane protein YgcG
MPTRRPTLAAVALALFGFAAAIASASPTDAATPWSITATPLTLTAGVATNVTLKVIPNGRNIDCVTISMPANFSAISASVGTLPGASWTGSIGTGTPTVVTFYTTNSTNRLKTNTGTFVIRVIASMALLSTWNAKAFQDSQPCSSSQGAPQAALPPFVILPGVLPTPTPTTAPTPTPTPSARPSPTPASPSPSRSPSPTPVPTATLPGTTARPTAGVSPRPSPDPSASDSSAPSRSPSPSDTASPGVGGGGVGQVGSGGSTGGGSTGGGTQLQVQPLQAGDTVQLRDFGALSTTALVAWLVPGALLTLPSLLIVLIVLAQAGFASAFVPVTRRVLGGGSRRRRRDQPGTPA